MGLGTGGLSRSQPARKLLVALVSSAFATPSAFPNPNGPQVKAGTASFNQSGSTLSVTNSPGAIIQWQSFSIGSGETTKFIQQSSSSAVLNRVVGQDPSAILGTLQSNGKVFLINPSGIVFGAGSRVDVAGLVASTLNISDADFAAGKLKFESGAVAGSVVNQGAITTPSGGRVYLVAPNVENHGVITTPQGQVILAAGKSVNIVEPDLPSLQVEIQSGGEALNVGKIITEGGKAGIYAGLINQKGEVRADSVRRDERGRIVFRASGNINVAAGSLTKAPDIEIKSESGTTIVAGTVDASATEGKGGSIRILGEYVGLVDQARVDASGPAGGGEILIGGDLQGKNPDVKNAKVTFVGPQAIIEASATRAGDGGKVIVWADDTTRALGTIRVRGGPEGGNGGFVETSAKRYLEAPNAPDLRAPAGQGGTWLIDPEDIEIIVGATTANSSGGDPNIFAPGAADVTSSISNATLNAALNAGNVTINTSGGNAAADRGNVYFNAPVEKTSGGAGVNFIIQANKSIYANSSIGSSAGMLHVTMTADQDNNGSGDVFVNGQIVTANGQFVASGQSIQVGANGNAQVGSGIVDLTARGSGGIVFSAGGKVQGTGNITVTGDNMNLQGGANAIDAGAATLKIQPFTVSRNVVIDATGGNTSYLNLTPSDFNAVNAGTIIVGRSDGTGNLSVSTALTSAAINAPQLELSLGNVAIGSSIDFSAESEQLKVTANKNISFSGGVTVSAGSLTLAGSGNATFGSGLVTLNAPVTATGIPLLLNTNGSTVRFDGTTNNLGTLTIGDLGQVLSGNGDINVTTLNWKRGTVTGASGSIATNGTLTVTGTATFGDGGVGGPTLDRKTLTIASGANGTFEDAGASFWSFGFANGGVLNNAGTVTLKNHWIGSTNTAPAANGTVNNSGNIVVSSALGGEINVANFNHNAGLINVSAGDLIVRNSQMATSGNAQISVASGKTFFLANAANLTLASGTTLSGAGNVTFTGLDTQATLNGNYTVSGLTSISTSNVTPYIRFNTDTTLGQLALSSGELTGTGNVAVSGAFTWTGGTISGVGGTLFITNGNSSISNAVNHVLWDRTWKNAGTVDFSGGDLRVNNGAFIRNQAGAVFNISTTNASTMYAVVGTGAFENNGTLNQTGSATNTILSSVQFQNKSTGVVNVIGGNLTVENFDSNKNDGTLNVAALKTLSTNGNSLTNNGTISGSGTVNLGGATLTNNGTINPGGMNAAGTLSITGAVAMGNTSTLNIELAGSGGGQFDVLAATGNVNPGGTLNVTEISGFSLAGGNNFTVVTRASGTGNFAAINSPANTTLSASYNPSNITLSATGVVNTWVANLGGTWNTGTNWSRGHAPNSFEDAVVNDITGNQTVTIVSVETPKSVTFNGTNDTLDINAGSLFVTANSSITNLSLTGGTLQGTGNYTITGSLNWTTGTIQGSGTTTVAPGATLSMSGSQTLIGSTLLNQGNGTWSGSGTLTLHSDGTFTNNGSLTATGDGTIARFNNGYFNNNGLFEKNGGAGTTSISDVTTFTNTGTVRLTTGNLAISGGFNQQGLVDVGAGRTVNISSGAGQGGGDYNIAAGGAVNLLSGATQNFNTVGGTPSITGAGNFNVAGGTMIVSTAMSADNLSISSGTRDGTGTLTVNSNLGWSGGTIQGGGNTVVAPGATLSMSGSQTLIGSTLLNQGNGTWSGSGTLTLHSDGTFTNNGSLTATGDGTIARFNNGYFNNNGLFEKNGGAGTTSISDVTTFTNTGTVRLTTGNLSISGGFNQQGLVDVGAGRTVNISSGAGQGGGDYNIAAGGAVNLLSGATQNFNAVGGTPSITGAGNFNVAGGTMIVSTAMNADNLNIASGTRDGTGTLTVNGNLGWSGGSIAGGGTTVVAGALNMSGTQTLSGSTLLNQGNGTWSGSGTLTLQDGTLTNNGSLTATGDGTITRFNNGFFNNNGLFEKNGGTGTTSIVDSATIFTNTGTVRVSTGTLIMDAGFTQNGTLDVRGGATFQRSAGFTNSGIITGNGTIAVSAGTLTNAGTVQPGGAGNVGTLTVTGNYLQTANGTLAVDIPSSNSRDLLAVSGTASLGGNLTVALGNAPVFGDSHTILTAGSVTGTFATVTGNSTLTPAYGATGVVLQNLGNYSKIWDGGGGDFNWFNALNWSGDSLPTSTDNVSINIAGTPTVTIGTGAGAVVNTMVSNESIALSSGSFTLTSGNSSMNGDLLFSGGTLAGAGQLTLTTANNSWSGGSFSGNLRIAPGAALTMTGGQKNWLIGSSLTNQGTVVWNAGTIHGGNGGASGSSSITNATGAVFEIQGDLVFTDIDSGPGPSTHTVTFDNQSGAQLRRSSGAGLAQLGGVAGGDNVLAFNLQNAGTFNVSTGTATVGAGTVTSNGGTFQIASGAVIDFAGGSHALGNMTSSGAGIWRLSGASVAVNSGATVNASNLHFNAGSLTGPGEMLITGNAGAWNGGTFSGNLRVGSGATFTLGGGQKNWLIGSSLTNQGTVVWNAGTIHGGNGGASGSSTITNAAGALFDIQGDLVLSDIDSGPGPSTHTLTFDNQAGAQLRRSAGAGTTQLGGIAGGDNALEFNLKNAGTFNVSTGTVLIGYAGSAPSTGTFSVASGAVLDYASGSSTFNGVSVSGAGALRSSGGSITYTGASTASNLEVTGGTMSVSAGNTVTASQVALSGGTLTGTGQLSVTGNGSTWTGGSFSGNMRVAPGATLALAGGQKNWLIGANLTNQGTVAWSAGTIHGGNGGASGSSTITNQSGALFDIQGDLLLADLDGGPGPSTHSVTFINQTGAELRRSSGAGSTNLGGTTGDNVLDFSLQNAGTFNVASGTVAFGGGFAGATNGGVVTVGSGATLMTGGSLTNAGNGVVSGSGTLNLSGGTLTNGGVIQPGGNGAVGTLSVAGNYVQGANGSLSVELASGSSYDVLAVSGTASLGGTLNVSYLGGYAPTTADSHQVLTASSVTGTFASVVDPNSLYALYGGANVTLTGTIPTLTWDGGGDGVHWSDANNWNLNVLPTANDPVVISDTAAAAIIVDSAATAKSVTSAEAFNITTGGTFTLGNASAFNNGFSLTGGTLAGNGTVAANGTFSWTGGAMNPGGNFTMGSSGSIGGSVTLNRFFTNLGMLGLSNASVAGSGTLVNQGTLTVNPGSSSIATGFNWQSGTIDGSGLLSLTGTYTLSGGGSRILNGATISPVSTNLVDGSLTVQSGIYNGGSNTTVASGATLSLTGGSFGVTGAFNNDGMVNINTPSLSLGFGGTSAGSYFIGPSSTLTLGGSHSFTGGVVSGNHLSLPAASSLTTSGALVPAILDVSGAATINGVASVGTLNLAAGGTVNGSGSLAVATDYNQTGGTLGTGFASLDLTRPVSFSLFQAMTASGFLRLNTPGTLTLNQPVSGGTVNLNGGVIDLVSPITASSLAALTGGTIQSRSGVASINAPLTAISGSMLYIEPSSTAAAGISASGSLSVAAPTVLIKGSDNVAGANAKLAAAGALSMNVGNLTLQGGAAANAYAAIDPTSVTIVGSGDLKLLGGAGADSYAAIHAPTGPIFISTSGGIEMQQGTGTRANAVIAAETGAVFLSALECVNCGVLFVNPVSGGQFNATGVYGTTVDIQVQQGLGQLLEQTVINAVLATIEISQQQGASDVLQVIASGGATSPIVIETDTSGTSTNSSTSTSTSSSSTTSSDSSSSTSSDSTSSSTSSTSTKGSKRSASKTFCN